jgi:hypothetical protein
MLPPDPKLMNDKRADAVELVLDSFALDFGEGGQDQGKAALAEQNLVDFMTDLAHFCDRSRLSLAKCISIARSHYADETANQGRQFEDIA